MSQESEDLIAGRYRITVDDDGLKVIARSRNLRSISLEGCRKFTSNGLNQLASSSLIGLDFSDQEFTPSVMNLLSNWKSLRELRVTHSDFNLAQAKVLLQEGNLTALVLSPPITSKEVDDLSKLYPDCKIIWIPKGKTEELR